MPYLLLLVDKKLVSTYNAGEEARKMDGYGRNDGKFWNDRKDEKNRKDDCGKVLVLRSEVYQANPMIQARKDFDLLGMRIFFLGLRSLNPHLSAKDKYFDEKFERLHIPTNELVKVFGNTKYLAELKPACEKLFDAIVELNYADGGFKLMHMFDELEYKPRDGLYIQFSYKMRPYILDLFQARGYTRINIKYLFSLSSPYAVRLLELMLQYQNIKQFKDRQEIKRKFMLEDLRFVLNVPEGAYGDRVDNFRSRVLDVAIREITTRTPYLLRYSPLKEGRKVVAFEFTMDTFEVPIEELGGHKAKSGNEAISLLVSQGFSDKDARAIFKKCRDVADCFARVQRAQALMIHQKRAIKNKLGFLRKAIEEEWQGNRNSAGKSEPARVAKRARHEELSSMKEQQRKINIGRKKMSYRLAETIIDHIRQGDTDLVNECLAEYKVSIEKFAAICEKNGL